MQPGGRGSSRSSSSRAERVTTSCSECRRRKQKCNQGHPCSNCARRFPQPACEYKENKRKEQAVVPNTSSFPVTLLQPRHDEQQIHGLQQPLLPLPETPPSWASEPEEDSFGPSSWSSAELSTQFPGSDASSSLSTTYWGALNGPNLPVCKPGCLEHSEAYHECLKLLRHTNSLPGRYVVPWDQNNPQEDVDWNRASGSIFNTYTFSSPMELLRQLPVEPTALNAQLLQIFVKLISRFKPSLDGNPDFTGPYHKVFMPFLIQSPLLAHVSIYTAACYLNETNYLDKTVAMFIKGHAIRLLNDLLRSNDNVASDEAIAGVAQLITDEWLWGETHDLEAHLRGLKEMIRVRGGFRNLGLNGILSKIVILADYGIAISLESLPFLEDARDPAFEYNDLNPAPFRLGHNTPLVASMVNFASCAETWGLHPLAASILDDIRFLIATIVSLPNQPSAQDLQKLKTTSQWMHNRISALPESSPDPLQTTAGSELAVPGGLKPRVAGDSVSQGAASGSETSSFDGSITPAPDHLYRAIRLAALLYTSAVVSRKPFSEACTLNDFYRSWQTIWRVSLTTWKQMAGIFLWILIPLEATARDTPHGRFVKSMLTIATLQIGLENWGASYNAVRAAVRLQSWLNGGRRQVGGTSMESGVKGVSEEHVPQQMTWKP